MGEVYARRLIDAGHAVIGFDVDAAKGERLAAMGGSAVGSIAEVAQACDGPSFWRCTTPSNVEDVAEHHIAARIGEGCNVSCCAPAPAIRIGSLRSARGSSRADCASSKRRCQAPASRCAAARRRPDRRRPRTMEEVDDLLAILFPRRFHVGNIGDGGPHQARDQSDPRAQPRGACRRTGVCTAARPRPDGISCRSRASRPPIRRSWMSKARRC